MSLFLTEDHVIRIHDAVLSTYGGAAGLRDRHLLQSALGQPTASMDGHFLHRTIFQQAAAYLFHISRNHPFVDGNKRTAAETALLFLELNHYDFLGRDDEFVELVVEVAQGNLEKADIASYFRANCKKRGK